MHTKIKAYRCQSSLAVYLCLMPGRALPLLLLTIFVDLFSFGVVIPVLPIFVKDIGGSDLAVGLVTAVYSLAQFFMTPVWGALSDRYGRRPIILGSTAIHTVSYGLMAFAGTVPLLLGARLLAGVGSGNISAAQAYISDITSPEKRAGSLALIGAAFSLGFIFGAPVGGFLMAEYGFEAVGWFTGGLCFLNLVLAFFILPESLQEKHPNTLIRVLPVRAFVRSFRHPGQRALFVNYFVYTVAFFMFQLAATLTWKEERMLSEKEISWLFSFIGLCSGISQGILVGPLVKWLGELRLMFIGAGMLMVCLTSIPLIPDAWFIPAELIVLFFIALANGLMIAPGLSLLSKITRSEVQGSTMGLYQSTGASARFFGPLMAGVFYGISHEVPYFVGAVLLLINFWMLRGLTGRRLKVYMARAQGLKKSEQKAD